MKTQILVINGRRMLVTLNGPHTPAVDLGPVPRSFTVTPPPLDNSAFIPDWFFMEAHINTFCALIGV